ncbi:MAG: hypothetical protein Q8L81_12250 [Bacteroidota bacterium]|nr:hypothetical protein [Bacteroidota bacterium]
MSRLTFARGSITNVAFFGSGGAKHFKNNIRVPLSHQRCETKELIYHNNVAYLRHADLYQIISVNICSSGAMNARASLSLFLINFTSQNTL